MDGRLLRSSSHLLIALMLVASLGAAGLVVCAADTGDEDAQGSEQAPPPVQGEADSAAATDPGTDETPPETVEADQPPAQPALQPAAGAPPQQPAAQEDPNKVGISANHVRVQDGATLVEGGVRVKGTDFSATSDAAVIDKDQIWIHFQGNVVVGTPNMHTTASGVDINIETSDWRVQDGRTEIKPEFFGQEVMEPLFFTAKKTANVPGRSLILSHAVSGTTCNKPSPHYALRSKHVTVTPGRKVVFDNPALVLFGLPIFKYPFDLVFALDNRQQRFIPEFGENTVEGKYAKLAYMYLIDEQNSGLLRLHFTENRGTGYGFDHWVTTEDHRGQLTFFYEPSENALTSRLSHNWRIDDQYGWALNSSYQQNSGYYGSSETLSNNLSLTRRTMDGNSQLGLRQSMSNSGRRNTRQFNAVFSHRERNGRNSGWNLQSNMRSNKSRAGQAADEELDAEFEYTNRQAKYDWSFVMDNRFDLDGSAYTGDDSYRALNRLPELTIRTDTDRLDGWRPLGRIATRAALELGRFAQDPDDLNVGRAAVKFDFGGNRRRLTGNVQSRTSARYYQSFYDEGSATYVVGLTTDLDQTVDEHWTNRLQINYSKPDGYSPIRLDYWGRSERVSLQSVRLSPNHSRLDLSSGYDFVTDRWQTALIKYELMTSKSSKVSLQSGYDIERSEWRPVYANWQFAQPRRLRLGLGAQYDIEQSKLWQGTIDVDWLVDQKSRIEFNGRYSGATHKLDQMDVRYSRDLHCWTGSVSYNKPTGDWQINLGLKAFPSVQANFGGMRGAQFQSRSGYYY